jgi:hypothetical protein
MVTTGRAYDGGWGTVNGELTTSVATASASVVAIAVALYAVWVQSKQNRLTLESTLLHDLSSEFTSPSMLKRRLKIAEHLLTHGENADTIPEMYDVLDFFDFVGLYHERGVISTDAVFTVFFYWMGPYWHWLKPHAESFQLVEDGVAYYRDFLALYDQVERYGMKHRGLPKSDAYFTKERLAFFLSEEVRTCTIESP